MTRNGRLLVVGTPIGNLSDLSPRALQALRSCSLLLCEDTRHTGKLLEHFGIKVELESFHEHNEDEKADAILARIREGETVALVSDAGMPLLSDPGHSIVRRARESGVTVEPIPGPFAAALALVASGLAAIPFTFYGFAPHREEERLDFYRGIAKSNTTAIVYESPNRVLQSLEAARSALGDVQMTLAREMTKMHEEFVNGTISEVLAEMQTRDLIRGEVTLVFEVKAREEAAPDAETLRAEFARLREEGLRRNDATRILADRYGLKKSDLYKLLLESE